MNRQCMNWEFYNKNGNIRLFLCYNILIVNGTYYGSKTKEHFYEESSGQRLYKFVVSVV